MLMLFQINNKLMSVCNMFATFAQSLSRYLTVADPDLVTRANAQIPQTSTKGPSLASQRTSKSGSYIYDPQRVDKMFDVLGRYEDNFARHLKILLDTLNYLAATETVVFLSLCARLQSAGEGGMVSTTIDAFGV